MNKKPFKITFIGAGNMTDALVSGILRAGSRPQDILVTGRRREQVNVFESRHGVRVSLENDSAAQDAKLVVLAVKPDQLKLACGQLASTLSQDAIIISVAAGIETQHIRTWLNHSGAIIRAMPNLASSVGESATALYADGLSQEVIECVEALFSMLGYFVWLEEEAHMSIATALAGSGPAYYYLLSELLVSAAVNLGLSREVAVELTKQTALGAAQLVRPPNIDINQLRQSVTSPNGTTAAALESMLASGLDNIINDALTVAYQRSIVLGKSGEK